jgi:hypothetical protein
MDPAAIIGALAGSDATDPGPKIGALAGFESADSAGAIGALAGFDASVPGLQIGALAGFALTNSDRAGGADSRASRTCRETDSRSTPSSRAIRRCDQPRACNESIDCTVAILSRFAIQASFRGKTAAQEAHRPNPELLKLAGFHAPNAGWF